MKARHLFGCYRRADAADPEIYAAAVAAIFSEFPPEVVDVVCDPRTGLPRTLKWLPTIAEIAEACEEQVRWSKVLEDLRLKVKERRGLIADPSTPDVVKRGAQTWLDERSNIIAQYSL